MEGKIVEDKKKMLFHLFISTLYLSAFTFGGGYVIVSLLKKKFVDEYHWIENDVRSCGNCTIGTGSNRS